MDVLFTTLHDSTGREGISRHAVYIERLIDDLSSPRRQVRLSHTPDANQGSNEEITYIYSQRLMTVLVAQLTIKAIFGFGVLNQILNYLRKSSKSSVVFIGYHWIFFIPLVPMNCRIIFIPFDCWSEREHTISRSLLSRKGWRASFNWILRNSFALVLRFFEYFSIRRCNLVGVVSNEEMEFLKHRIVKPTGRVDLVRVPFPPIPNRENINIADANFPDTLAIVVWMDCRIPYGADSVRLALNAINNWSRNSGKALCVDVLSRVDDDLFRELIPDDPSFKCTNRDFVESIDEFLEISDIVILPDITGSGVKNRTLTALGAGKIVIATEAAIEGIHDLSDNECYTVVGPERISETLCIISDDIKLARAKASRAADFVRRNYDSQLTRQFIDSVAAALS